MQAIYDLVGDKIREIFDAQVVDIGIFDFERRHARTYPYAIERGVRVPGRAHAADSGPTSACMLRREAPVSDQRRARREAARGDGNPGERAASRRSRS